MHIIDRAITVDNDRTIGRATGDGDAIHIQSILSIRIIPRQIQCTGCTFIDSEAIDHGNRQVVLRRDRQAYYNRVRRSAIKIINGVTETIRGGFSAIMRIVDRTITIYGNCPVNGTGGNDDAVHVQPVLGICVIRSKIEGACRALIDGVVLNHSYRQIILWCDRQTYNDCIRGTTIQVIYCVAETV